MSVVNHFSALRRAFGAAWRAVGRHTGAGRAGAGLCAASLAVAPAFAVDVLDEVRFGVAAHDLANNAEDGPQAIVELVFASPKVLAPVWSPRPYLYGSFNTQGNTHLASAGLNWRAPLLRRVSVEGALGLAYQDGPLDINLDVQTPEEAVALKSSRALLGSQFLFRTAVGLDAQLTQRWRLGVFYEHFSHGQLLGDGRNQGLDEIGARIGYSFQ